MTLDEAIAAIERAKLHNSRLREGHGTLAIRKFNPGGMSGHQTVEVAHMGAGIDWEGSKLVITPVNPLTELTPEDVAAIHESVKKGGSWHAYQSYKKQADRIKELEAEIVRLKGAT